MWASLLPAANEPRVATTSTRPALAAAAHKPVTMKSESRSRQIGNLAHGNSESAVTPRRNTHFNEPRQPSRDILECLVASQIHFFDFLCLHEALGLRVVIRVAR